VTCRFFYQYAFPLHGAHSTESSAKTRFFRLFDLMLEAHFHGLSRIATLPGLCDKRFGFAADRQIGRFRGQISKQWGGRAKNWAVNSVGHS
jgi:hypothetical protein